MTRRAPATGTELDRSGMIGDRSAPGTLLLLRAPAGYGKSTAVEQWAQDRAETVVRFRCAAGCGFWGPLAAEVAAGLRGPGARPAHAAEPGRPWAALLGELQSADAPVTVVIDDYHAVSDPERDLALVDVARSCPAARLIVLARRVRVLDGPLVSGRGAVRVLGPGDLALSPDEMRELATRVGAEEDERLRAALRRTEGWPVAVGLILQAVSRADAAGAHADADGDPVGALARFALSHLEVLGDPERAILLAASLLDAIGPGQAADVAGLTVPETRGAIHALTELGLLGRTAWGGAAEYRCHPAVRPALATRALRSYAEPERAALLRARSAELEDTSPFRAFRGYCEAGAFADAERVLARQFSVVTDEGAACAEVLRRVPEQVLADRPTLAAARLVLERADPTVPAETLRQYVGLVRDRARERRADEAACPEELRRAAAVQLMSASRLAGDLATALPLATELEGGLGDAVASAAGPGALPTFHAEVAATALVGGDLALARRSWERLRDEATRILEDSLAGPRTGPVAGGTEPGHRWLLAALGGLAVTEAFDGDLARAAEHLDAQDALAERTGAAGPGLTWVDGEVARALLAVERGDAAALRAVGDRLAPWGDRNELWAPLLVAEAEATRAARGADWALSQLAAGVARARDERRDTGAWRELLRLHRARLLVWVGDTAGAGRLLSELPEGHPGAAIERARVALFDHDDVGALLAAQAVGVTRISTRARLDRCLIAATAAWSCGRHAEAFEAMRAADGLIGQYRLSAGLWGVPHDLLRDVAGAARDAGVCDATAAVDAVPAGARVLRYERLTESERRTLEAIAEHRTVGEAAASLFLTQSTIKTHLKAVYRKLRAGGREEAILLGTRMGLLPRADASARVHSGPTAERGDADVRADLPRAADRGAPGAAPRGGAGHGGAR